MLSTLDTIDKKLDYLTDLIFGPEEPKVTNKEAREHFLRYRKK
jgi:hypothetical protein